jgi:hypothetical protein
MDNTLRSRVTLVATCSTAVRLYWQYMYAQERANSAYALICSGAQELASALSRGAAAAAAAAAAIRCGAAAPPPAPPPAPPAAVSSQPAAAAQRAVHPCEQNTPLERGIASLCGLTYSFGRHQAGQALPSSVQAWPLIINSCTITQCQCQLSQLPRIARPQLREKCKPR